MSQKNTLFNPAKVERTFNPPNVITRKNYPPFFCHVAHVPPDVYSYENFVQFFDIAVVPENLTVTPTGATFASQIPPQPSKLGVSYPIMLFHEKSYFVATLYRRVRDDEYTRVWSEIAPYFLPKNVFPQPPVPACWKRTNTNGVLECAKTFEEICQEKWKTTGRYHVWQIENQAKSVKMNLTLLKTTRVDNGEPLTYYIDRLYALYSFALVLDVEHASQIKF
jgi:hypothetical protein